MTIIDSILNGQFLELFTSLYTMLTRFLLSKTCFIFKLICSDIRAIKTVWFGYLFGIIYLFGSSSWLDTISPKLLIMFDPHLGWCKKIFVATLNISELHHPKCGSNMINNFGEIVSSLLTADHTCRRSDDETLGMPTTTQFWIKFQI